MLITQLFRFMNTLQSAMICYPSFVRQVLCTCNVHSNVRNYRQTKKLYQNMLMILKFIKTKIIILLQISVDIFHYPIFLDVIEKFYNRYYRFLV